MRQPFIKQRVKTSPVFRGFFSPRRVCKADVSTFALISAPISGSIWIGEICLSSSHLPLPPPSPPAFVIISSVRSKTPRCLSPSRQCIKCHPLSNNRILFVFINTPINCSNCEAGQAGRQTARWCLICCCGLVCMCASSCAYLTHTPPTHTLAQIQTPPPPSIFGFLFLLLLHSCCNDFYTELSGCCLNRGSQSAMPLRPTAVLGN